VDYASAYLTLRCFLNGFFDFRPVDGVVSRPYRNGLITEEDGCGGQ
jgi:hypothetical protein